MRLRSLLLLALVIGFAASASALSQSRTPAGAGVEEILVTGEHPGPGLWKVTNGEHTLWILGTHGPLPRRLTWKSQDVELVMTEAQQVIGPYSASFTLRGVNPFAAKGRSLRRVLSRKTYAQWQSLKQKYIGKSDEVETALPVTAALLLRSGGLERGGLSNSDLVWKQIYALANQYNVRVTTDHQVNRVIGPDSYEDIDAPRVGVDYLVDTITNLETELRTSRERANAWAVGDIDLLQRYAALEENSANLYASSWPFLREAELQEMITETDRRWIDAAEQALRKNRTTLAALPIVLLLRPQGMLAVLRAKGFAVEAPVY